MKRLKAILDEQRKMDGAYRGWQPNLTYGCFERLDVKRTEEVCEGCKCFSCCQSYLEAVKIRKNPFEKED